MSYCASKAAVDMITKCSAIELAPYKIRVNSVNPTIVMTDMGVNLWSEKGVSESALNRIPLGKFAETDHCTNAILFMLSDLSGMTTGETFLIDGGCAAL
jgi:L-xylulose reductase